LLDALFFFFTIRHAKVESRSLGLPVIESVEGDVEKQLHVWITNADYEQLKTFAAEEGEGLGKIVRQAIRLYIRSRLGRPPSAEELKATLARAILGSKTVQ
jgi:hypothetical protein